MHGTSVPAGWLALLLMLAWFGLACLIVFLVCCVWCRWMRHRDERARKRRRPGYLPDKVARSYCEPARLTNEALDTWPVLDREPRQ